MCMAIIRRIRGVRLLLKRPFLEPMNEGNMRRLAGEPRGGEERPRKMR